jgi:hypothetical protein
MIVMNLRSLGLVLLALLLVAAPLHTWLTLGGDVSEFLQYDTLRGQVHYLLSKLCALYAIELVWVQAMMGLMRQQLFRFGGVDARRWALAHRALGTSTLLVIALHIGLFVVAASMRNKAPALDLLLPWGHGAYRTWVAFGAAAMWLFRERLAVPCAVKPSSWRRSRRPAIRRQVSASSAAAALRCGCSGGWAAVPERRANRPRDRVR